MPKSAKLPSLIRRMSEFGLASAAVAAPPQARCPGGCELIVYSFRPANVRSFMASADKNTNTASLHHNRTRIRNRRFHAVHVQQSSNTCSNRRFGIPQPRPQDKGRPAAPTHAASIAATKHARPVVRLLPMTLQFSMPLGLRSCGPAGPCPCACLPVCLRTCVPVCLCASEPACCALAVVCYRTPGCPPTARTTAHVRAHV